MDMVYLVTFSLCVSAEVLHHLSCYFRMFSVLFLHSGCRHFVYVFVLFDVWIWFESVAFDFFYF